MAVKDGQEGASMRCDLRKLVADNNYDLTRVTHSFERQVAHELARDEGMTREYLESVLPRHGLSRPKLKDPSTHPVLQAYSLLKTRQEDLKGRLGGYVPRSHPLGFLMDCMAKQRQPVKCVIQHFEALSLCGDYEQSSDYQDRLLLYYKRADAEAKLPPLIIETNDQYFSQSLVYDWQAEDKFEYAEMLQWPRNKLYHTLVTRGSMPHKEFDEMHQALGGHIPYIVEYLNLREEDADEDVSVTLRKVVNEQCVEWVDAAMRAVVVDSDQPNSESCRLLSSYLEQFAKQDWVINHGLEHSEGFRDHPITRKLQSLDILYAQCAPYTYTRPHSLPVLHRLAQWKDHLKGQGSWKLPSVTPIDMDFDKMNVVIKPLVSE